MQGADNGFSLLDALGSQCLQHFHLIKDVQMAGRLVQQQYRCALTKPPGNQHLLLLSIAELVKQPVPQLPCVAGFQAFPYTTPILFGQQSEKTRMGIAPHGSHIPNSAVFQADPIRKHGGHLFRIPDAVDLPDVFPAKTDDAPQRFDDPGDGF